MISLVHTLSLLAALDAPVLLAQADIPPPPPPSMKKPGERTAAPATAPEPEQPVVAPKADAPTLPAAPARSVFLTVNSNRADLLLFRRSDDAQICAMPCNQLVAAGPDDVYYLGGKGISPSSRFDLTETRRAARIDIRAGSRPAKIVGIIFTSVSIPVLLNGAANMVWYGVQNLPDVQSAFQSRGLTSWFNPLTTLVTAIIELAIGGALLGTGIPLWAINSTRMTTVETDLPGPPSRPAPAAEPAPSTP